MNSPFPQPSLLRGSPRSTPAEQPQKGFTLVELLVVMAIIGLLVGLVVPATTSLLKGRGVDRSINDVASIVEYARAEAMGRRSYVWVLFANTVNSDGNSELRVVAATSTNGMNYWGSYLTPVTKVVKVANVNSVDYDGLPTPMQTYLKGAASDLLQNNTYVGNVVSYSGFNRNQTPRFVVGGQDFNDVTYLGFSPEGELTPGGDPYNLMFKTQLSIGLAPMRGTALQKTSTGAAVITVYGGSAKLRITKI